jgi:hypothetical protein
MAEFSTRTGTLQVKVIDPLSPVAASEAGVRQVPVPAPR